MASAEVQSAIEVVTSYVAQVAMFKRQADAARAELDAANETIKFLSSTLEAHAETITTLTRTLEVCRERADAAEEVIRVILPGLYDADSMTSDML